jgi:hypothetical protein
VNIESAGQKPLLPDGEVETTGKKPYIKPMVRHERVFETMALSCGKVQSTEHGCHFNRKTS